MASSTLGKQRANRRSHRNGAVCRFLAALGAGVILAFGVGAPIAAAQAPTQVRDGGGDPGPRGPGDERVRAFLERLIQHVLAERRERGQPTGTQSTPPEGRPPAPTPSPSPVPVPVPVPVVTPPVNAPNPPNLVGAVPTAAAVASARTVQANATSGSVTRAGVGADGTSDGARPDHVASPPAAAPTTLSRSPVARVLRTARSYGALLALAAAVVVFLLIQGRVDRRDPRILSAPAEERLTFQDFE